MYLGRVAETGPVARVFSNPRHPYTRALIDAVPRPDPKVERGRDRVLLSGELPSPTSPPSGCVFRTRCPLVEPDCARIVPPLEAAGAPGHLVACPVSLRLAAEAAIPDAEAR
jgi:oligopeptide/dipeptide ABC transporter ATP-binding protein